MPLKEIYYALSNTRSEMAALGSVLHTCIAKTPREVAAGVRKLLGVLGQELSAEATAWEGHSYCPGSSQPQPRGPAALLPQLPVPGEPASLCPAQLRTQGMEFGDSPPILSQRSAPDLQPSHFALQLSGAHPDTWGIALPSHRLSSSHSSWLAHTHSAQSSGFARESATAG